ncbi:MAG: TPM domain-containing protein [Oscillospiraceae bacterium]|nr:TPM domain-containing protein [Oscillospiraceae bacterium]
MKFRIFLIVVFILIVLPFNVFAVERFIDEEGLLTPEQAAELNAKLDEISERYQFDIVVATVYSFNGQDPWVFTADFFEANGFGLEENSDGIILLLATEDRDFALVTTEHGSYAFSDRWQEYMEDNFLPHLKVNDYFQAFMTYARDADAILEIYNRPSEFYEHDGFYMDEEEFMTRVWAVAGCVVVALVLAAIVTGIWKRQLKSVLQDNFANAYIREGSMALTSKQDIFLHRRVNKTIRPKNTGSGGSGGSFKSSSGRSYSGRSGKY